MTHQEASQCFEEYYPLIKRVAGSNKDIVQELSKTLWQLLGKVDKKEICKTFIQTKLEGWRLNLIQRGKKVLMPDSLDRTQSFLVSPLVYADSKTLNELEVRYRSLNPGIVCNPRTLLLNSEYEEELTSKIVQKVWHSFRPAARKLAFLIFDCLLRGIAISHVAKLCKEHQIYDSENSRQFSGTTINKYIAQVKKIAGEVLGVTYCTHCNRATLTKNIKSTHWVQIEDRWYCDRRLKNKYVPCKDQLVKCKLCGRIDVKWNMFKQGNSWRCNIYRIKGWKCIEQ